MCFPPPGRVIFKSELKCDFVNPLLSLSSSILSFQYMWSSTNSDSGKIPQVLKMKNVSSLGVKFFLKTAPPFSLDLKEVELAPGEEIELTVFFNPNYRTDRLCSSVKQQITITYEGHPQKDVVQLVGDVYFPNLTLSETSLDFGTLINETSRLYN